MEGRGGEIIEVRDADTAVFDCRICKKGGLLKEALILSRGGQIVISVHPSCLLITDIVIRAVAQGIDIRFLERPPIILSAGPTLDFDGDSE
jgi:hypothetical protein